MAGLFRLLGVRACAAPPGFLNRPATARKEQLLPRPVIVVALICLAALLAGFLLFGGANMGH